MAALSRVWTFQQIDPFLIMQVMTYIARVLLEREAKQGDSLAGNRVEPGARVKRKFDIRMLTHIFSIILLAKRFFCQSFIATTWFQ